MNHSNKSLNKSISTGAAWMVGVRWTIKSLGLISSIVLARILVPEDFGLIALAMSVYALVRLIREFGFGAALIQNQNAKNVHYNTAWTLQVIMSTVAALILLVSAPLASSLYDDGRLVPLLMVLSFTFFITGFNNIAIVDFRKNMTFDKVFVLNVVPKIVSFITTISLAFYLRNYWALLLGQLVNKLVTLVMSYIMHSYRPRFQLAAWRELMGFSSWLMINNFITYMNRHGRNIVLAKVGGAPMVGLLSVSTDFATIVSMELIAPINTAAYPGFSRVSKVKEKLSTVLVDVISAVAMLAIPGAIGLAVITPIFVPVVLGEKWLDAIAVMPAIAYASVFMSFSTAIDVALMATVRQKVTTLLVSIRLLVFFPLMFILLESDGASGVANAILISNLLVFPLYTMTLPRYFGVSMRRFLSAVQRPIFASAVMFAVVSWYVGLPRTLEFGLEGVLALATATVMGFLVFLFSLITIWWIQGKPVGVESRVLKLIHTKLSSVL